MVGEAVEQRPGEALGAEHPRGLAGAHSLDTTRPPNPRLQIHPIHPPRLPVRETLTEGYRRSHFGPPQPDQPAASVGDYCAAVLTQPTAIRRARPTTGTSGVPAIIRCLCSTSLAIWSGAPCAPATSIAPMAGATFWNPWLPVIGIGRCGATSEAMQPSPRRTSMSSWKPRVTSTRSVSRPTRFFKQASLTCSRVPSVARPTMCAVSMPASAIRPPRGTGSVGWSPGLNGIPGNWFPGSASSSPT